MTTEQLQNRISGLICVGGNVRYSIEYRGRIYQCSNNDTLSIDRIRSDEPQRKSIGLGGTYKQALQNLYDLGKEQYGLE